MQVQPYLFFEGRCEEAVAFYQHAIGAELITMMRYQDNPEPQAGNGCMQAPPAGDKVMHMAMRIGATTVMGSDGRCEGKPAFQGFALSLNAADEAAARKLFDALGDGGQVLMPLGRTFFSPAFGMVADRFGVSWMVLVAPDAP